MLPRKLRIKAIGPFQEEVIDLASIPGTLIAITGRNGQGKTFLLENLICCLYRILPSRPDGVYSYCTNRNAGIELEFEMAGKVYRSVINIDSKGRKMEAVLATDGMPLNDGKTGPYDDAIAKLLGPKEQILASSYGSQEKNGNFVTLGKAQRKDLFIRMIGMKLLQQISERAGGHGEKLFPEKTALDGKLAILKATADKPLPELVSIRDLLRSAKHDHDELYQRVYQMTDELAREGVKYDRLPELESQWRSGINKTTEYETSIGIKRLSLQTAKELFARLNFLQNKLNESKSAADILRERVILLREKSSKLPELVVQESALKRKYVISQSECDSITRQISENQMWARSLDQLRQQNVELGRIRQQYEEDQTNYRQVSADLLRMSKESADYSKAVFAINSQIAQLTQTEATANMKLESARKNSEILGQVPCQGVGEFAGCQFIKNAVSASGQIDDLMALVDNTKISLLGKRQEIESLPRTDIAVEKQAAAQAKSLTDRILMAGKTIAQLEKEVALLPKAEAAQQKLESLQEALKTQEQIRDLAAVDQASAEASIKEIGAYQLDLTKAGGELKAIEDCLPGIEDELRRSQAAEVTIQNLAADIARLESELNELKSTLSTLFIEIKTLEAGKEQYEANLKAYKEMKEVQLPELKQAVDDAGATLNWAEQDVAIITTVQAQVAQVEKQLRDVEYRMMCYARVAKAFGPMEIQSFEIDSAGPAVSQLANDLLFNCFGPRFSIQFVTQELKVDGKGYKDEFDVSVQDQETGRTGSIGDLSGGEKTIVSEALALAIALYNKEKNGVAWETLFRDEVSGALDEVYAPQYIAMLRAARARGNFKRVFFICHQDRLKELADSKIIVANGKLTVEA